MWWSALKIMSLNWKIKPGTTSIGEMTYKTQAIWIFFLETYKGETVPGSDEEHWGGHKWSDHSPYCAETGCGNRCHVLRQAGHETLPDFVGCWFPRQDNEGLKDDFAVWMLFLLKLWRFIEEIDSGEGSLYNIFLWFKTRTRISSKTFSIITNVLIALQSVAFNQQIDKWLLLWKPKKTMITTYRLMLPVGLTQQMMFKPLWNQSAQEMSLCIPKLECQ